MAREHEPALFAAAMRLTGGDRADAQDLVQDTFERALAHWDRLAPGSNERGWLVTVLHNRFIDQCRRRRRGPAAQPIDAEANLPAPEPTPAQRWDAITPEHLARAIAQLDDEFRAAYELKELQGKSYDEIARALGIPKATVGTRILRARRKLRALLEEMMP
jgi:RNA polymerase sigma-70 factor (ECF subfamily)